MNRRLREYVWRRNVYSLRRKGSAVWLLLLAVLPLLILIALLIILRNAT